MEGLTPKERMMLQEQLRHEQVCISKYRDYAAKANPATRAMFTELAREEEDHYRTLSGILEGGSDGPAATTEERPIPVDAFGRQSGWKSTARQMLFRNEVGSGTGYSERNYRWGGLLPGDIPDTNHGDLTRGGLGRRGVPLPAAGGSAQPRPLGSHLDAHGGLPPPGSAAHVMPSHLERDGQNVARIWGEPDSPRVGSLRTRGVLSATRFIYGGQEPAEVSPQEAASQFKRWRGPGPPAAPQHLWYGPTEETGNQAGLPPAPLARPSGPVSLPDTRMEAAQEWDGVDLSPWSDLTSPVPLGGEVKERTRPPQQVGPANAGESEDTMLTDMLMTERFISGAYDSAVFDSSHPQVRQALHRIQEDEQRHGERIVERLRGKPGKG